MREVDCIIVGGGLAGLQGSHSAWTLFSSSGVGNRRGRRQIDVMPDLS